MNITLPDTVLRNDEIINIKKKDEVKKPKIVSDTIPTLVQDVDGKWVSNPLFIKDTDVSLSRIQIYRWSVIINYDYRYEFKD